MQCFYRFVFNYDFFCKNVISDFTENSVPAHAYIHTTGENVKRIVTVPGTFVTLQKAVLEVNVFRNEMVIIEISDKPRTNSKKDHFLLKETTAYMMK